MTNMIEIPHTVPAAMRRELGGLLREFAVYRPDPNYSWSGRVPPPPGTWKVIKPQAGPPIPPLPLLIQRMLKATWKYAEPSWDNTKGALPGKAAHGITIGARPPKITIGTRRAPQAPTPTTGSLGLFSPQVRPTTGVDASGNVHGLQTTFPNDTAIASDWNLFKTVERTNAVTFRGDSRSPSEVITNKGGFGPPNSRDDRYYLENNIYFAFADYLKRRYQRDLTQKEFLTAVDSAVPLSEEKKLLVDYLMWRKITEKEAVHLGRMVETECLKGYISTARGIDTAIAFGTRSYTQRGWVYVTVVHGGFVVPLGQDKLWGTEEGEIAQWGPIPAARIVGFARAGMANGAPVMWESPIFIRRSFLTQEPVVFDHVFKVMSGMIPP